VRDALGRFALAGRGRCSRPWGWRCNAHSRLECVHYRAGQPPGQARGGIIELDLTTDAPRRHRFHDDRAEPAPLRCRHCRTIALGPAQAAARGHRCKLRPVTLHSVGTSFKWIPAPVYLSLKYGTPQFRWSCRACRSVLAVPRERSQRGKRWLVMPKQLNGSPGKKPPASSVKRRPVKSFSTMVEILKSRKPRRADEAESGRRPELVPARCRG